MPTTDLDAAADADSAAGGAEAMPRTSEMLSLREQNIDCSAGVHRILRELGLLDFQPQLFDLGVRPVARAVVDTSGGWWGRPRTAAAEPALRAHTHARHIAPSRARRTPAAAGTPRTSSSCSAATSSPSAWGVPRWAA